MNNPDTPNRADRREHLVGSAVCAAFAAALVAWAVIGTLPAEPPPTAAPDTTATAALPPDLSLLRPAADHRRAAGEFAAREFSTCRIAAQQDRERAAASRARRGLPDEDSGISLGTGAGVVGLAAVIGRFFGAGMGIASGGTAVAATGPLGWTAAAIAGLAVLLADAKMVEAHAGETGAGGEPVLTAAQRARELLPDEADLAEVDRLKIAAPWALLPTTPWTTRCRLATAGTAAADLVTR